MNGWQFSLDFNNWGHVNGTFWTDSENPDSSIPHRFGMTLSGWIHNLLSEKGIYLRDMADVVDNYVDLNQSVMFGSHGAWGLFKYLGNKFLRKTTWIPVNCSDEDMRGELEA